MRCAAYIRVSTNKEEQKLSIQNQKSLFIDYIKERNWTVHDFFIDIETGTTAHRENLQRLIQEAKQKKFDVIIAKELSRLARNGSLSYQIRDVAQENKIGIITLDGAVNSIEGDVSKYGLYTWLYEEESQRTSQRVKTALKTRAQKGYFKGSQPPYGYIVQSGKLYQRDDETPNIVKWMFSEYIKGRGFDSIARYMISGGYPTPATLTGKKNANKKWHGSTVKVILQNPHYTGQLVQQRETTISATNKSRIKVPIEKQITVPDTHEPLISEETFNLVQDLIKSRANKRKPENKHLFSSLIYCNDCGSAMHFKQNRKGYVCGGYVKYTKDFCTHHAIKEVSLVQQIIKDFDKCLGLLSNSTTHKKLLLIAKKEKERLNSKLNNITNKVRKLQERKSKLVTLLIEEVLSKEDYHYNIENIEKELQQLNSDTEHLNLLLYKRDNVDELQLLKAHLSNSNYKEDLSHELINRFIRKVQIKNNGTPIIEYRYQILNHLNEL
jgi:DNA invertase Pin-like site-specific DNA recombinase